MQLGGGVRIREARPLRGAGSGESNGPEPKEQQRPHEGAQRMAEQWHRYGTRGSRKRTSRRYPQNNTPSMRRESKRSKDGSRPSREGKPRGEEGQSQSGKQDKADERRKAMTWAQKAAAPQGDKGKQPSHWPQRRRDKGNSLA